MQTKFKRLAGILVLAIGGLAAGSASSAVLYDNSGSPIDTGYPTSFFFSDGNWGATQLSIGSSTCGPLGCTLDKISLRLGSSTSTNVASDFSNFDLSIYNDNGSGAIGTAYTSLGDISNPVGPIVASPTSFYEFEPTTGVTLYDDTSYWVKLSGHSGSSPFIKWDIVSGGTLQFAFGMEAPPNLSHSFVMKVEATPVLSAVPIPGAVWLMGSALIGFVGWGRRLQV